MYFMLLLMVMLQVYDFIVILQRQNVDLPSTKPT